MSGAQMLERAMLGVGVALAALLSARNARGHVFGVGFTLLPLFF
jgi:hypothetical protein